MTSGSPIVYIVDDDTSVCRALALLLKAHGFRVEAFTRAKDFLAFKHPKTISCLVSDLRLPNMSGLVLQETMTTQGLAIPIIFISGHGNIPKSVKAMKGGAVDFLPKPFTVKKLINAIEEAIVKSKALIKEQAEVAKIWRRIKTLSPRELEVFRLVANGMLSKQIAFKRGTSLQVIKVHRSRVMYKMQAKTVTELIHFAQKAELISPKA
ncbi:MAG TPA: response regulator [Candidatus Omnitrophota bacterium]|nr:response regulator [Candidatus Omnitrophota bacterium]HPD84731.1 response regulator [Candidatus Omnitrophota bacterium]HRZ03589.1 response regulator [Candidatus Omnitrophota bacterium]